MTGVGTKIGAGGFEGVVGLVVSTLRDVLTAKSAASTASDAFGRARKPFVDAYVQVSQGMAAEAVLPLIESGTGGVPTACHQDRGFGCGPADIATQVHRPATDAI